MGLWNAFVKLGCNHDWDYSWQSYDGSFSNPTVAMNTFARLKSCYEFRRCSKCKGYEFRWEHNYVRDRDTVDAQVKYLREHPYRSEDSGVPAIVIECTKCHKRGPEVYLLGD